MTSSVADFELKRRSMSSAKVERMQLALEDAGQRQATRRQVGAVNEGSLRCNDPTRLTSDKADRRAAVLIGGRKWMTHRIFGSSVKREGYYVVSLLEAHNAISTHCDDDILLTVH